MAFVLEEQWEAHPVRHGAVGAQLSLRSDRWEKLSRHGAGLLITLVVHMLLFAVLIFHLFGGSMEHALVAKPGLALMAFDLGAAKAVAAAIKTPQPSVTKPPAALEKVVQSEWQPVAIKVLVWEASPPAAASTQVSPSTAIKPAGGGGFDPYAGSAPTRPGDATTGAPQQTEGSAAKGMSGAFARLVQGDSKLGPFIIAFQKRHPGARGLAYCHVQIGSDNRVRQVLTVQGSMPAELIDVLRKELVGQTIVPNGPTPDGVADIGPLAFTAARVAGD